MLTQFKDLYFAAKNLNSKHFLLSLHKYRSIQWKIHSIINVNKSILKKKVQLKLYYVNFEDNQCLKSILFRFHMIIIKLKGQI